MNKNNIAIFPGSFDPFTVAHKTIVEKGLLSFTKVIILVCNNENKKSRFSLEERAEIIRLSTQDLKNIEIQIQKEYESVPIFAKNNNVNVIIRGLRVTQSEINSEFNLFNIYKDINPNIEVCLFFIGQKYLHISSSAFVEMAKFKVLKKDWIDNNAIDYIKSKLNKFL